MKRYEINWRGLRTECPEGEFVTYEDAQAAIQSERAEAEKLFAALVAGASGFEDDGSAPPRIQGLLDAIRARGQK